MFDARSADGPSRLRLVREAWSLITDRRPAPDPAGLPHGGGLPVLVIPAFLTGDGVMGGLRRFLARCGFRPFGWGLGTDWGPTPRLLEGAERRLLSLSGEFGPVSIVGVSMGGLFARHMAFDHPGHVRHVVTLASPIRLPTASTIEPLIRLFARRYSPAVDPARLRHPLPVPSTSLYTQDDGLVDWRSCFVDEPLGRTIELTGPHLTIASNPDALRTVVQRLADPSACPDAGSAEERP